MSDFWLLSVAAPFSVLNQQQIPEPTGGCRVISACLRAAQRRRKGEEEEVEEEEKHL